MIGIPFREKNKIDLAQESLKSAYQDLLVEPDTPASYRKNAIHFFYWTGFVGLSVSPEEMRKGDSEQQEKVLLEDTWTGSDDRRKRFCDLHAWDHRSGTD